MHIGICIFPTEYSIRIDELAREMEQRNFESLFVPEHTHIPTSRRSPFAGGQPLPKEYAHTLDPFVGLMAAAAATTRLRVGTGICLVIERDTITSLLPNQRSFTLPSDREAAADIIHSFAPNDAARYRQFMQLLDMASGLLRSAYAMTPPHAQRPTAAEAAQLAMLAGQLSGYGRREMTEVLRVLVMSVRDLLDEWFESAELKGVLGSLGVRGLTQGPFAGGT